MPKRQANILPSWREQYDYRKAEGKHKCSTCSAFKGGACQMFDGAKVEPDYTCDEWSSTWKISSYIRQEISFERLCKFVLKADWNDIVAKAKAIIGEGRVTILNNTPQHVMSKVVGDDHDGQRNVYEVELAREDPDSNVVTQSTCTCKWSQFRWDRTRPWKPLEGRPCKHILATFWKAKSVPLDVTDMPFGYQAPPGQKRSPAGPGQMQIPMGQPSDTPAPVPSTKELTIPQAPENPFSPQKKPQTKPGQPATPVPQREQLELFNINPPMTPAPPAGGVSVPGGQPPTPENPIGIPGTFSNWHSAGEVVPFGPREGTRFTRNSTEYEVMACDGENVYYTEIARRDDPDHSYFLPIEQYLLELRSDMIKTAMSEWHEA